MRIKHRPTAAHQPRPSAVTIGNFDGVHLGHQALFAHIVETAKAKGLVPTALTFSPQPLEFFSPAAAPARISTLRDKLFWMARQHVKQAMVCQFNAEFSKETPAQFVKSILVDALNAKHVWVGDDFKFGFKRSGDFETLRTLGLEYGFTVERIESVVMNNHRVSSTEVRAYLASGNVQAATKALGHPLTYSGHVVHGKKLGRTLGYPTLNMWLSKQADIRSALTGILAVWVHGLSEQALPGVASLGRRPTVEHNGQVLLETHVFDWAGDAYGKNIVIEVVQHLRSELKFNDLDSLKKQMHIDSEQARAVLQKTAPSELLFS
jgi:riboflavin kinase/FMN adenylyltransferase